MTQFTVKTDLLRAHASDVRHIATAVDQAADAANEVGIGGIDAYGAICSGLIVPALELFFGDAVGLVRKAGDLTDAYADGLEANSDVYESVDQDAKSTLNQLNSDTF
ncbi:MAG: type VII secretion target [Jatrophihabitantaceae bacterium]